MASCKAPVKKKGPKDNPPKDNLPVLLTGFDFVQSFRGTPTAIGCSDGQREGFANLKEFPNIAGCVGSWQGRKKLNADRAGAPCGDDGAACASPADLCAPGWHICARDGNAADLHSRISYKECDEQAGPGRFVAAMSHGQEARICPPPPLPDTRFPCMERGVCAEPVCCGDACSYGACRDAVWRGKTKISRASANGCGTALSKFHGGILCCRDIPINAISATDVQGNLDLEVPPGQQPKPNPTAAPKADKPENPSKGPAKDAPPPGQAPKAKSPA